MMIQEWTSDLNRICYILIASLLDRYDSKNWLRSWVQIHIIHLCESGKLRYRIEIVLDNCRQNLLSIPKRSQEYLFELKLFFEMVLILWKS
jgi:hypothetical protein